MKIALVVAAAASLGAGLTSCSGSGPAPAPAATTPVALARTGQTSCWDSAGSEISCLAAGAEAQDGRMQLGVAWPEPRFTTGTGLEEGCLTDHLTGLTWTRTVTGLLPWAQAVRLPAALELCGQRGWRLPNKNELRTLTSYDQPDTVAWLTSLGFVGVPTDWAYHFLWSSTSFSAQSEWAWAFNTLDGEVTNWGPKSELSTLANAVFVRDTGGAPAPAPVPATGQTISYGPPGEHFPDDGALRAGVAWPAPRFVLGAGVEADCVTDGLTGLTWVRSPDPATSGWAEAFASAGKLVLCGHDDWRLPNVNEMQSLMTAEMSPATWLNLSGFWGVQPQSYWTSTTFRYWVPGSPVPSTDIAYALSFANGEDGGNPKQALQDGSGYAATWPVRGGRP